MTFSDDLTAVGDKLSATGPRASNLHDDVARIEPKMTEDNEAARRFLKDTKAKRDAEKAVHLEPPNVAHCPGYGGWLLDDLDKANGYLDEAEKLLARPTPSPNSASDMPKKNR